MKEWLERSVPVGIDYRTELRWVGNGLLAGFIYSLSFFSRYLHEYNMLFTVEGTEKILDDGAVMPVFMTIMNTRMVGFATVAGCMILLAAYHYAYHYRGSKSIYLMRRLPDRWELFRRCVTLPVLGVVSCLCIAFIIMLCYYAFYMWVTPEVCLAPGQWQKIWQEIWTAWLGVRL